NALLIKLRRECCGLAGGLCHRQPTDRKFATDKFLWSRVWSAIPMKYSSHKSSKGHLLNAIHLARFPMPDWAPECDVRCVQPGFDQTKCLREFPWGQG